MLKFSKNPTFTFPVIVQVPQDGGGKAAVQFTALFRVASTDRIDDLSKAGSAPGSIATVTRNSALAVEAAILSEVVVGWEQVQDETGADLPFSDVNLKALAGIPYIRTALFEAYHKAIDGRAAQGN